MIKITLSTTFKNSSFEELYNFAKKVGFDGLDYDMGLKDLFIKNNFSKDQKEFILCLHEPLFMIFFENKFLGLKTLKKASEISLSKNPVLNFHLFNFLKPMFFDGFNLMKKINKEAKELNFTPTFESGTKNIAGFFPKETVNPLDFSNFCLKNNLNMTMDVSHLATFNYDIVDFFKKYYQQIKLIHLSDFKNNKQHLPLFTGELPLREFLKTLKQLKWNGVIAFEIFKFNTNNKNEKFKILEDNLKEVRKILEKF